jgi:fructose-bisphosphate aldolase class II
MKPISGNVLFKSLKDEKAIIMACNVRITRGVARGILRAAKETDSALIFEIARSESDTKGGYTGMTPAEYAKRIKNAADEVDYDIWALHADHIGVKKGTPEDIEKTKELIKAQIDAGFTSFAIDASHLFNFNGKTVEDELSDNIKATVELANFIEENTKEPFGLEVEVGEIGRENDSGRILTTPEEAVTFIKVLKDKGIDPNVIAIANGSAHGNTYDKEGNLIEQVSIDIPQTIAVGKSLEYAGFDVKIAQHGITGTPLSIIKDKFPKDYIRKGNVATHWMNLVWDVFKEKEPELYKQIWDWTIENHSKPGKSENEIFGKESKRAIIHFLDKIDAMGPETEKIIEEKAYNEALKFFDAFNAKGTAEIVRNAL